jgi:sulfite reductase beta subunit-like hemoprotein
MISYLEQQFPDFDVPLRVSVTGCPNSCAHYQICDIGFVGDLVKTPNGPKEGYRIYLGGHLGDGYVFGRELEKKIFADEIKFYVERMTRAYLERREPAEDFQQFIKRHAVEELEAFA